MRSPLLLPLLVLAAGCDSNPVPDASAARGDAAPGGRRCADLEGIEECAGGECRREACRGDEVCQAAACIPWTSADLRADFTLETSEVVDRRVIVTVRPGGFPRAHVEALRFDFGDGVAGWGERLRHDYAAPGVYPVDLEVRLAGHRVLRARKIAVLDPPPDHEPLRLTVNRIPETLNGSRPVTIEGVETTFSLRVPTHGFVVDVELLEDPARPVVRETLSLTADVHVGDAPAGAELVERLVYEDPTRGAWWVGESESVPEGRVTFRLSARTADGAVHERTLALEAVTLTPALDPFDRPMIWLFRTDRDFFATQLADPANPREGFVTTEGADGTPDLVQELALIGAQGPDETVNARYLAIIQEAIRAETYRTFGIAPDGTPTDDIALTIFWQGEDGAPDPAEFSGDGDFSMMRFGGVFNGFLGFSGFSPHNEMRVDDSTAGRGVATAGLLHILVTTPLVSDALAPLSSHPVGSHPADAIVLAAGFDPYAPADPSWLARYHDLRRVARYIALAIASVTAHEMGHAMGLMPDGVPPEGYFGGVSGASVVNAERTNSLHADFPGLNLMQAGGDYLGVLDEALASLELPRGPTDLVALAEVLALETRLSAYARAYLQRRLTYGAAGGGGGGLGRGGP